MSKGRQLSEFKLECSSATCTQGPAGAKVLSLNFTGEASAGYGMIVGTASIDIGKSGQIDFCAVSFKDNGDIGNASGSGYCRSAGQHRWTTQMHMYSSDGGVALAEGLLDLATSTWTGKGFEWLADEVAPLPATHDRYRDWLSKGGV